MSLRASGSYKGTNQVRLVAPETCVVRYDAGRYCQRLQNRPTHPCAALSRSRRSQSTLDWNISSVCTALCVC